MLKKLQGYLGYVVLFILTFTPIVYMSPLASADQLLNRSVTVGSSAPNVVTNHRFSFDLITVGNIGSIQFEYCSNTALPNTPCTAPFGLNTSAAVLSSQTGEVGFIVDPLTTASSILISRPPSLNSAINVTYNFTNITNPTTSPETYYVRISTFATSDGSGPSTDFGAVAFATETAVNVAGYVPPYIIFCVGVTVSGNCSSASGQLLSFGELSANEPRFVTSQFAGATNDPGGYSTFVSGVTMTSGTNTIPANAVPTGSIPGFSQFGMNLRANTVPSVGSNPSGVGTTVASADYNQPNLYKFNNQIIANSTNSTDFNVFTVSYVVNVSQNQAPGIYNTTLTYIATAAF